LDEPKLLNNPCVVDCKEDAREGDEIYPREPIVSKIPLLVEVRVWFKNVVEKYPAVPKPSTVETSCREEIYPRVASPVIVDVNEREETYLSVPMPTRDDVN